jgi:hypothetical protein
MTGVGDIARSGGCGEILQLQDTQEPVGNGFVHHDGAWSG